MKIHLILKRVLPLKVNKQVKNLVMMSQKFEKNSKYVNGVQNQKNSFKSLKISSSDRQFMTLKAAGKNSENDDRKTFISSTERQAESTLNRSKNKQVNKPSFRVKRVNKKFEYNSKGSLIASHTPEKTSYKSSENKIIITKRKVSGVRDNEETRPMPLYTSKQTNNILTPLIV